MPEPQQPHTHSDYEETFRRVATILDVIAQEQQEQAQRGAETDARIAQLAESQKATDARLAKLGAETDARIKELTEAQKETDRALREYVEQGRIQNAETTDKLNGLIDLMDRHIREHGRQ